MTQTRLGSLIESVINVAFGFVISLTVGHFVFPSFGWNITPATNVQITLIFTVTSILRQYIVRRWFNARLHLLVTRLTESL